MTLRTTILVLIPFLIAIQAAPAKQSLFAQNRELPPNQRVEGVVSVVGRDSGAVEYALTVPDDAYSVTIAIDESPADLDLFVTDERGELVAYSERTEFNESITLSRIGDPPLETGRYTIEVAYQYSRPPVVAHRQLTQVPFTITATFARLNVARSLAPGEGIEGVLSPEHGMAALYEIRVPTGVEALRLDISDTDGDVDLFLSRDEIRSDPFAADYWAQSVRSSEVLIVDRDSIPPLRPGRYYVLVIDQIASEFDIPFTLTATAGQEPPASLSALPAIPASEPGTLERALVSTVELLTENAGGSGVIVSPAGHILTNFHVIRDDSGAVSQDITVGLSLDQARPPVETFVATVVATEEERDLALLQITGGRYGGTLPGGYRFPALPLRRDVPVAIGERLHFVGYPWIGGTGSRASVTYTQGVVSGFQATPFASIIKSDGEINEGNSGGAALNDAFALVGLPTQTLGVDGGQLAYITPLTAIPDEWFPLIGR